MTTSAIQATARAMLNVSLPAPPDTVRRYVSDPERLLHCGFPPDRIAQIGPDHFQLRVRPLTWMGLAIEPTAELEIGADEQGRAWARLIDYRLQGHPWLVKNLKIDFRANLTTLEAMSGGRTPMEGWAEASASFPTPPFLAFVAEPVLTGAARTILESFLWILRDRLSKSLEQDFRRWQNSAVQVNA
ncbi:DUF1997 domain-containing protein [Gloeobacter kilaueensis]|uniref:DUF1997 domain-containing protein n=1 Tax=Gloeobacter kilaueensis TaxID=1416614 RepID=UPI0016514519|nr:DUF1997 domain-containing protein [Gloeobacter kilaueensis]